MRELLDHCRDLPIIELGEGDVLIEQGRHEGPLYVMIDGSVVVERDGIAFARNDSAGAVFGEMAALLDAQATATVRVTRRSRFHVADDAVAFLGEAPPVALAISRTLAGRLDNIVKYLTDVKRQYADQVGHLGMVDELLNALVHQQAPDARPGSARMPETDY